MKKINLLLILIIFMFFTFISCSKSTQSTGIDLDAKTYKVSASELGNGYIKSVVSDDSYIYILNNHENQYKLQKISLDNNKKTDMDLTDLKSNQVVDAIAVDSAGNYLLLVSETNETGTGAIAKLIKLSATGEAINESNLTQLLGLTEYTNIQNLSVGKDDTVYLTVLETSIASSGTSTTIYALNPDINKIAQLAVGDYVFDLIVSNENEVYLSVLNEFGDGLKKVDFRSGMTTEIPVPIGINHGNIIGFTADKTKGLLCADGTGLLAVDPSLGTADRIFYWLDGNISINGVRYFGQFSDNKYWAIKQESRDSETYSAELLTLTETTYRELPAQEYITCATAFLSTDILDAIVEFNKSNGKYHINVKEYLSNADPLDEESMAEATMRLHLDITGNNPPDLLNLDGINFEQLAAKGAFYNLDTLFDQTKINSAEYLDLTFNTYASKGMLYAVFPSFDIKMLVGHESKLGNIDRWTISEMIDWAEKYPDAKLLKGNSMDIISLLLGSNYAQFVNWEKGDCHFNSKEFIRILEFVTAFYTISDNDVNSADTLSVYEGIKAGEYLLLPDFIFMLNSFYEHDAIFDGEARYIGYPTEEGNGIFALPMGSFAIPSGATNKDGAFAFIEYLLSEEYQNNGKMLDYSIPVKKSALEAYAEKLKVETYGYGKRVPIGYNLDNILVMIDLAHDEEYLALLMDIIARVDGIMVSDEQILKIINEEAGSLFAGQKTATEVAEIIQNRVQVYVNENR